MLKAYCVFAGDSPWDWGYVLLVYAQDASKARWHGYQEFFSGDVEFIEMRARRAADFDQYCSTDDGRTSYSIDTNDDLPADAPDFYSDELY